MDKYAIIVAGGSGTRMGTSVPKQFLLLKGKPLLWYSIKAFLDAFSDIRIILVLPEQYIESGQVFVRTLPGSEQITITAGGSTRFQSVKNGLEHVPNHALIFVHDGVRCLLTTTLIHRCYEAALINKNAVPAVPAIDSLRVKTSSGSQVMDRATVMIVQTPQTFFSSKLKKAYCQEYQVAFTDDASVMEHAGESIHLVEGEDTNIKLTRKLDLVIAEQLLTNTDLKIAQRETPGATDAGNSPGSF